MMDTKQININCNKISQKLWSDGKKKLFTEDITRIYKFFESLFSTENNFYEFINKFSFKRLKKLSTAIDFYYYFDYVIHKEATPLRALLMIFVIEGAIGGDKHIDFYQWLKKDRKIDILGNKNYIELSQLDTFYKNYKENYGSGNKFRQLFNKYLTTDEKIMLLKAFSFSSDGVEFHQVCYSSEGNCCDYYKCALRQPNQNVDSYIDKIAKMLYDIRCDFAHNAKLNHFTYKPEENYESCLIGVYSNKLVEIRLSFDSFEDLARKMIYRYLEDKICKNINWQSP